MAEFSAPSNDRKLKEQQRDAVKALFAELNDDGALPDSWHRTPSGQPRFLDSQWQISISHSGHFVAIALCLNASIGVDIQLEKNNKLHQYADYLKWPKDQLFRRWCLYEATFKAAQDITPDLIKKVGEIDIPSNPAPFPCLESWALCWSPVNGLSASLVCSDSLLKQPICTNLKFSAL
ncbi:4'-phosphopantetheinyl transferase family protein [Ferrimonas futtsuensis]|uniref:4'-phosphopantetheinyl transferase family protein n=1 Tax=Ferrimonas futtsuensis TaxID=364764 RepID=UPI0012F993B6|nr:hypothetical protein [Ferrimonas futtsuensis]